MTSNDGHVEVVRLLLEHGADSNVAATDTGDTALIMASQEGQVKVIRLLLERSADPNVAATDTGDTALIMASRNGRLEVVRLLLEHSADPNVAATDDRTTALCAAAINDQLGIAQLLTVYGATLSHTDHHGLTAQQHACESGHDQLATWLGAVDNYTPFQIAVGCRLHADARSLLRTGALGDPTVCTVKQITDAATGTPVWGASTVAMPPVCRATTRLARNAMACWSPKRHWPFHSSVREAVHMVLLVEERLKGRLEHTCVGSATAGLPYLPNELWFLVCAMLLRRDWMP